MELSNGGSLPRGDIEYMRKAALQSLKRKSEGDSGVSPAGPLGNDPKKVALRNDDDVSDIYKKAMLAAVQLNSQYDIPFELVLEQTDVKAAFLVSIYQACGLPIPHLKGQYTSLPNVTAQVSNSTPNSKEASVNRMIPEQASQPPLSNDESTVSADFFRKERAGTEPGNSSVASSTQSDKQYKFGNNRIPAPIYLHDTDDSSDDDSDLKRLHHSTKKRSNNTNFGLSQLKAKEAEIKRISEAIARLEAAKNGSGSVREAQAEVDKVIGTASSAPYQDSYSTVETHNQETPNRGLPESIQATDSESHIQKIDESENIRNQLESELKKYDLTVEEDAIRTAQLLLADRKRNYENLKEKREAILQRLKALDSEAPKPSKEPMVKNIQNKGNQDSQAQALYELEKVAESVLISESARSAKFSADREDSEREHASPPSEEDKEDDEYEPSFSSDGVDRPGVITPEINPQSDSTRASIPFEAPRKPEVKDTTLLNSSAAPSSNISDPSEHEESPIPSLVVSEPVKILETKPAKEDELFYQSPLRYFKSFRLSPEYLSNVGPEGYRSLTFSNKIDPKLPFCVFETMGGICNDDSCRCQHMESIVLNDDDILLQMISVAEGNSEEELSNYKQGLKKRLMETQIGGKASTFEDFINAIISFRREVAGPDRVIDFNAK